MWTITAAFLLFVLLVVNGESEVTKPKGMNQFPFVFMSIQSVENEEVYISSSHQSL